MWLFGHTDVRPQFQLKYTNMVNVFWRRKKAYIKPQNNFLHNNSWLICMSIAVKQHNVLTLKECYAPYKIRRIRNGPHMNCIFKYNIVSKTGIFLVKFESVLWVRAIQCPPWPKETHPNRVLFKHVLVLVSAILIYSQGFI